MESSDESFAWTDDSEGDSDNNTTIEAMNDVNYDDELKSNKKHKKKLQKKLFEEQKSPSHGRVKCEPESDTPSHDDSYLALRVKQEQASFTVPTSPSRKSSTTIDETESSFTNKSKKLKKKKNSDREHDESHNKTSLSYIKNESLNSETLSPKIKKLRKTKGIDREHDESNLSYIKNESLNSETLSPKIKKLRKTKGIDREHDESNLSSIKNESLNSDSSSPKKKKFRKSKDSDKEHDESDNKASLSFIKNETLNSESSSSKKKKSSKRKDSESTETYDVNEMVIEDKFSAEETVVETRPNSKKKVKQQMSNETLTEDTSHSKESRVSKIILENTFTSKEFITDESSSDDDVRKSHKPKTVENNSRHNGDHSKNENLMSCDTPVLNRSQRTSKISDRIQFEDEDTVDMDTTEIPDQHPVLSSKVRKFLSAHSHLHPLTYRMQEDALLTPDDEVWVLHCPQELDITTLTGTNILLDTDKKCKFKVNGQTYNGTIDDVNTRKNLLSIEHDSTVIKSVPIMGTVRFHKRIPKVHFTQDSTIQNNQTDFIPLPETKCRHPLFGPDYKRAMKIPAHVRHKLHCVEVEELPTKKKHKKERPDAEEPVPDPEPECEPRHRHTNRKRKHKHTDTDEPTSKKKRIKHELSAADAWDSEKAIEENLFNF